MSLRLTPPRSSTMLAPSTICRVSSAETAPAYMPANCGWLPSMMHFSIDVVANGQPSASIACRSSPCNPRREIVKAGRAATDFAPFNRAAIAAIAFFSAASFDFSAMGLTSVGTTGVSAWSEGTAM